ncbi:hypothetical protein Tco_0993265 [Tanacetum coccineum]|uniref:Uncharacterized protein n=1 Tax=Tanacetum coccineum TaxID=301880 RepID=A0ABQ5F4F2_9ASTR
MPPPEKFSGGYTGQHQKSSPSPDLYDPPYHSPSRATSTTPLPPPPSSPSTITPPSHPHHNEGALVVIIFFSKQKNGAFGLVKTRGVWFDVVSREGRQPPHVGCVWFIDAPKGASGLGSQPARPGAVGFGCENSREVFGLDVPMIIIADWSTHGTIVKVLAGQKSHEEQKARRNVALVLNSLALRILRTYIAIWLALQMKFEKTHVQRTACRPSAIRLRDQDDPHDDAHLEGENSAKRQKTSEYEAYVSGESSSRQDNVEEPGPSTLGNQEQIEFDFWTDLSSDEMRSTKQYHMTS